MTRDDDIYSDAKFYSNKKIPVHIKLKSGIWLNGIIKEVKKTRLILIEDMFKEMPPIKFSRIKDDGISPRRER